MRDGNAQAHGVPMRRAAVAQADTPDRRNIARADVAVGAARRAAVDRRERGRFPVRLVTSSWWAAIVRRLTRRLRSQSMIATVIACFAALDGKAAIPAWTLTARRASSH